MGLAHIAHDVGSSISRVPSADLVGAPSAALAATRLPGRGIRLLRAASYCSVAQPEKRNKGSLAGTRRMTWCGEQTAWRVEYVAGRWSLSPYSPTSETWRRVGSHPNRKATISAAYGQNQR